MGLNKNLRILSNTAGKVVTTDANGVLLPSDKDVNDIASQTALNNLTERVGNLESATDELQSKIENINGEVVE